MQGAMVPWTLCQNMISCIKTPWTDALSSRSKPFSLLFYSCPSLAVRAEEMVVVAEHLSRRLPPPLLPAQFKHLPGIL